MRQQLLTRSAPPSVEIVLDEAVLHRPVGGPSVMREQLDRIVSVAGYPNVSIQVLSFAIGAHPALESDFIILDFGGQAARIVYVEGLVGQIYVERLQDLERYQKVWERLRTMSLSSKDSLALLTKIRETYTNG